MNKRFIDSPKFTIYPDKTLNLSDPILVYNNGRNYKIIDLKICKKYPVIHDKFYDITDINESEKEINSIISDITIIFCPFTYHTSVFFGTFYPTNILFKNSITLINDNKQKLIPILGELQNDSKTNSVVRRSEAKIMTLRNAIAMFPDCYYLDDSNINMSVDDLNKHELDVVYTIEYRSSKVNVVNKKYTAIVGNHLRGKNNTKYDIVKNGIDKYLEKNMEKIREKNGVVASCSLESWKKIHPDSKIIDLK